MTRNAFGHWTICSAGTFYQPPGNQIPLSLVDPALIPELKTMSYEEQIVADPRLSGIAVRGSTMDLVVEQLHEGITDSISLEQDEER
jgi:hypothetical protein